MAQFFYTRRRLISRVTLFAVVLLLSVKDFGMLYSQAARSVFNTKSQNSSSTIWEWTLCKSKGDFPTSDTRIILCFGDSWVRGGINDRSGSNGDGYYIPLDSGECYEYEVLEPIMDQEKFITRGYVPSFYMGKWDNSSGGRYYFKPHNNTNYYIEHIDRDAFEKGCDNWWFETVDGCHKDENTFGSSDVYWMFKVHEYGNNEFGFYIDNSGDDFYICNNFTGSNRFGVCDRGSNNSCNKIRIYKGRQLASPTVMKKSGSTVYTIKNGNVMTVKDITYLPRNYYLDIEDGAMLIVSGRFINNGTIRVNGTLIVDGSGFIFPLDSEMDDGRMECNNGDIIIKDGGKVDVKKLKMNSGMIVNKGELVTVYADMDSTLIDNSNVIITGSELNRSWLKTGSDYTSQKTYEGTTNYYGSHYINIKNNYRIINNNTITVYVNKSRYSNNKSDYGLATAKVEGKIIPAYSTAADRWITGY